MLNLDHLACFIEVASQRSFTKAAERLFLSQSTVSRRIGHLEEELGCRLIERTALDFELTPEGKTALELGSVVLEKVALLQSRVKSQDATTISGTVAVGLYGLFRHLDVAGELRRRMGASYPQVHIDIRQRLLRNLTDDFRAGHVDIAVAPYCELPCGDGVERRPIMGRRMVAYLPQGHPLAKREKLFLGDLRQEPVVFWEEAVCPGFYRSFVAACEHEGFFPAIVERHDHEEQIMFSVQEGRGITVLFDHTNVEAGPNLAVVPLASPDVSVDLGIAYRRTDGQNCAVLVTAEALTAMGSTASL